MLAVARIPAHRARGCCCSNEISEGPRAGDRAEARGCYPHPESEGLHRGGWSSRNFRFAAPLADRFYVMEGGRIVKQFEQSELDSQMGLLHELSGRLKSTILRREDKHDAPNQ